jgi:histidine triad (HIT) family protein
MCSTCERGAVPCVFCQIAAGEVPAYLVLDEPDVLGFLDLRPVFKGHTLVVPRAHVGTLLDVPADGIEPLFDAVQRVAAAVETGLGAGGSWVSVNNRVSQSVPHLHVHVVPRTKGDGLKGFFWPRTKYADDAAAVSSVSRLREALPGTRFAPAGGRRPRPIPGSAAQERGFAVGVGLPAGEIVSVPTSRGRHGSKPSISMSSRRMASQATLGIRNRSSRSAPSRRGWISSPLGS